MIFEVFLDINIDLAESGPDHMGVFRSSVRQVTSLPSALLFQIFTVQLTLGEQVWEAEGTSIKKAQHSTAAKALEESVLPRPAPRSPKVDMNSNPGTATPTKPRKCLL